ncbi:bifunctional tRNA (5-methylaminomethyl-2-thiouridine)(34)-methyltransferase MnmD/FAD-dependent 5-carboxymethylaminomethyl-2-thiouridine(34) oxidoreductase MnmC [Gallaecimonas kandeliae]|uniref:bifunctional tRNA (5-methylaminomethyl-2-thiouridine)(34)-methyltransferase MnmD/FAD-dependent 5-carboxymethylaminomethyl-2-thiouridine(34) oxidoreductase MnmC n=1 Tax=Gallaecimonas kandeliae TaxID=3029055 RepID=UPI0026471C21|nr:bifunctional tRNA (5-methylaminomethyl-2-thiouridine)(34)-methyltransferase MnmD/FAD-dependent 5-carboxymethylaminomethyl-2-thiouridine(34) oxidoreductase MnmC [Gallaecimonas kandeliae]WKE64166.1 bifunctional tRNA (5-methylaminomethyl-2-thiouridine)(34)-methyltransferase MnmD/FAD-dependent 5-carboxymethylaminomethyl-2-thiouridine(34) oxidoreductase MnmC [Gallaecimonas kandeliae]
MRQATIHFNEQGTPVAADFGDVYFSNASGLEESRHVFLKNNGLPERFAHHQGAFVIAETGFGTGLNFLAAWQAFDAHAGVDARLHFISTEKFPLTRADLAAALAAWPELAEFSAQLIKDYPPALPGCHRLLFCGGRVTLDLWLGDIAELLPAWHRPQGGLVDAWFLDGFAPAKNPQMWQQSLFDAMARLAKPGGSFATFTAAGFVRRGLLAAGFEARKVPGFGSKREMLAGRLTEFQEQVAPGSYERQPAKSLGKVAIIGAGLAGSALAWQLRRRGIEALLFCKDKEPAVGASGNPQGALYPLLNIEHDAVSQLFAAAFGYSRRIIEKSPVPQGLDGLLQLALDDKLEERYRRLAERFKALCRYVDADEAGTLAGIAQPYPGLYFEDAGWLKPPALVDWLLGENQVRFGLDITAIDKTAGGWRLMAGKEELGEFDNVLLAAGAGNIVLAGKLPLTAVRGQISQVEAKGELAGLKTVLCHNGYMTPAHQGALCIGASFVRQDLDTDIRYNEHQENLEKLQGSFPDAPWLPTEKAIQGGNAGTRVVLRDHLPMVGALPDEAGYQGKGLDDMETTEHQGLWLLGGLGARGVTSGLLCADVLVSQLLDEPQPLPQVVLDALMPNRFWVRRLKKGQPIY